MSGFMGNLCLNKCTTNGSAIHRASELRQFSIADVSTRPRCVNLVSARYMTLGVSNA